jgi:hypothetical protein
MLSPADLLDIAESFAARVPLDPTYAEERQISWELLGRAFLNSANPEAALRALRQLGVGEEQAALRLDFASWASDHPDSALGVQILRETVDEISQWEAWFTRKDFSELTPLVYRLLGETVLRRMADGLEDSFTKTMVVTNWACVLPDPEPHRALLREAEEIAVETHSGNRDWALDYVSGAYRARGWDSDALRVDSHIERDLDDVDRLMDQAKMLLTEVDEWRAAPEPPPDSARGRLSRFLNYRYNDLKVRWLADQAALGGLDDPQLEAQVAGEPFLRIEPPRQPNIHKDPSHLAPSEFAAFFFARAVPLRDSDEDLLCGDSRYSKEVDSVALVAAATRLFLDFGTVGSLYREDQIEQGLWFLFGFPYFFFDELMKDQVPEEAKAACLEAMVVPFRDYLQMARGYSGSAFDMWWDHFRDWVVNSNTVAVSRRVLTEILVLPDKKCQFAALHGLNHLPPDAETSAMIDRYLDEHRAEMTASEIEWIKACREGRAL